MTRIRPMNLVAGATVLPLVALLVAGCGGGGSGNATASVAPPKTTSGKPATVGVATTSLGKTLVDSHGRTLYLFKKDSRSKSACFGACAANWPPLRVSGKPTVGKGASASLVATTPRSDGKPQVTYNGHPVYRFQGDSKAGDTNGQGLSAFGARWYALSPAGKQISGNSSTSSRGY
jgi:predicted lipoprotein with Yx(FWY)xxD motif